MLALDEGARIDYICKHHGGTAEYTVLQRNTLVHRHVVLYLTAIADYNVGIDVDILTDVASGTDASTGHYMRVMPDFRALTQVAGLVNTGCFMHEGS